MQERAGHLIGSLPIVEEQLEREFEALLVESSRLAFRVAFGVLRHHQDAEDVAQEALAKAYRSFHKLRDRNRVRPWLVRMVWRLAINRQRTNRRQMSRDLRGAELTINAPSETMAARERAEELWEAIDALPDKMRLVVVLAGIQGHDVKEVGGLLGLPEGTVKSRLFQARRLLRARLQ